MMLPRLQYPITRSFTIRHFTEWVLVLGLLWVGLVTLFNVAALGYETIQVYSTSFTAPRLLWYEKFSVTKALFPASWVCAPALVEPYQRAWPVVPPFLTIETYTSMGFSYYNIVTAVDPRDNTPITGLLYANYPMQNCSVLSIMINVPNVETQPVVTVRPARFSSTNHQARIACNTSVGQFFIAETTSGFVQDGTPTPVSLTPFWKFWVAVYDDLVAALGAQGPVPGREAGSFFFSYNSGGISNSSIAGTSWELDSASNYTQYDDVRITYVPGQGIRRLVPPPVLPPGLWTNTTFWQYMGVLFEGLHWMFLADFGQTLSTAYPFFDGYNTTDIDFSGAESFASTNNIFVNSTLYQSALRMMAYGLTQSYDNGSFADVGLNLPVLKADDFPLVFNETVLVQSYYCQQRRLKQPASLLATLLAADYVLIIGGYKLVTWIAELVEKRRAEANYCTGHPDGSVGCGDRHELLDDTDQINDERHGPMTV